MYNMNEIYKECINALASAFVLAADIEKSERFQVREQVFDCLIGLGSLKKAMDSVFGVLDPDDVIEKMNRQDRQIMQAMSDYRSSGDEIALVHFVSLAMFGSVPYHYATSYKRKKVISFN